MTMKDLLGSAVIAALVSGVIVFTYQQWLQTRIKRLEGELDRQRDYQRRNYELFVTAYGRIWTGLVDIEHWLRHNLWADIQSSPSLDPERWTIFYDTYKSFRGEMLFLPDSLYTRTQQLIRDVERNLNVLIDVLRDVIVAREQDPEGYATNPELLARVNAAHAKVTDDYRAALDELRHDYQAISRDLLLGDIARELDSRSLK